MAPRIGLQDEFEGIYTEKFRSLAKPYGEFIRYERDRAALDIGVHLTERSSHHFRSVANTRVWFQLKGIHSSTLSAEEYDKSESVPLKLRIDDLRFWYASPEAVYLAVYIESKDEFLCEEVRDAVDRLWGERIFHEETFLKNQKTARVRISSDALLTEQLWLQMLKHRSLRIDGPSFRGRPLGHRLDPLRCIPNKMGPDSFEAIVKQLLSEHRYHEDEVVDPALLFPDFRSTGDAMEISTGTLHHTYEWVPQIFTEFGFDAGSIFRIEGEINFAHGRCAVLIHSNPVSYPDRDRLLAFAENLQQQHGISRMLIFVNEHDARYFGSYSLSRKETGVDCAPQLLGDLAFNILTSTLVYLEHRDKISWRTTNYLF